MSENLSETYFSFDLKIQVERRNSGEQEHVK